MKFSYKKIFGGTHPAEVVPPIKCPKCCYPCTPICTEWPDCNFVGNCNCDSQTTPNETNGACACCSEVFISICSQTCAYNCATIEGQCADCNNLSCTGYSGGRFCSTCEFSPPPSPPIGGPIGSGSSCQIVGGIGGPYVNRIDLRGQYGGFTGFPSRMFNFGSYGCGNPGNCGLYYGDCDPDYARPYIKRYFKSPEQSGVIGITGFGIDYACLSWKSDKSTRVMALSGRNVYRYSGYLAGDTGSNYGTDYAYGCTNGNYVRKYYPWISTGGLTTFCSDPNLNPIGISGISEMEGYLGRAFPLEDRISGLPLWGQTNQSVGITNDHGIYCGSTAACVGCECLTGSNVITSIGHFGYGLTSQRPYNPQGYIAEALAPAALDYVGDINPIWRGIPSCSVWAFANAVYDRIAYLTYRSGLTGIPNPGVRWRNAFTTDGLSADENFPQFGNFIDIHHEMFKSKPDYVYTDPKDPNYKVKNMMNYFANDWSNAVNRLTDELGFFTFKIQPPNVFLYDRTPYDAASTTEDAWKHIYIIGNANVLFDSGCTYPDGLTNSFDDRTNEPYTSPDGFDPSTDIFSTDDVRHHIFRLDEINHALNNGRPGLTANSARLVVFPACEINGGETAAFQVSINPLSPFVIHGECAIDQCGVYQIETDSLSTEGLNTLSCACSVCARIGDGTNRYPAYSDSLLYTQLGGNIPSCYSEDPTNWRRNPNDNRYFPHPRLMSGTDSGIAGDCRYYGPRRLYWYF